MYIPISLIPIGTLRTGPVFCLELLEMDLYGFVKLAVDGFVTVDNAECENGCVDDHSDLLALSEK